MSLQASAGTAPAAHTDFVSDEGPDDGKFLRIGDLAREFDVSLRTLRFYEDKGLLNPKRDGVTRLYTRRDKTRLQLILLGRRVGFSLRDVKHMIDLYDPSGTNVRQLRLTLEKSEKQMTRLHKQRQSIDEAIGELSGLMTQLRERLAAKPTSRLSS